MWFKVRASDTAFADASRKHFTYDFRVEASPGRAFELVTDPAEVARWLPDVRSVKWVTSAPHGIGSVREGRLPTIAVQEKVLVWEPGERFSFTIVRASVPILKRMVEDYRFDPASGGATRVRWTIAYQVRTLAAPLESVLAPRFARMFEVACQRLARVAAEERQAGAAR